MQLTNIARDVCEDRDRNRQYIKPDFSAIKETINESQIHYAYPLFSIFGQMIVANPPIEMSITHLNP